MHAHGERSVGVCQGWRYGALSACLQSGLAWLGRVVQWLEGFERWTGGGGVVLASSQTRLARLVLLIACCPHWGDMGALVLLTIDDIGEFTVLLRLVK